MEFTIYSIGDSAFLEQVLIALAMIAGVDDFGAMVQVGMAVGVFIVIVSAISKGGKEIEFQHILLGYILWATMFVPTARVIIEDTYTGDLRVVDNVPVGPAAAGGIISLVGYKVTELFEVAYGPIVPKVTETEFGESLRIINDIRNKSSQGAIWRGLNTDAGGGFVDLRKSWVNYIKDCTLKKIDLGIMSPDELTVGQYQTVLQFNSILFGTQVYLIPGDANGQNLNCTDAWTEINNTTQFGAATIVSFNAILGLGTNNLRVGENSQTKTQDALDALLGAGIAAQTYMEVAILEPVVMKAAAGKYDEIQDLSGALMINQAIQQRNTTWAAEQTMFMSIVRPMLAFFEAFIYAIAPIMAFVMVLGAKGIQLAAKYFTMIIWIQLWMPLLAIVNLYIYTAASRSMASYTAMAGHNWDSFYALNSAADTAQNWIATGGLLASSTPALALMLIYGSAVTATHLAGRLKSSDVLDEKYQTPDIKNSAPLANTGAMYSGDMVSGMMITGAQNSFASATIGSQISATTKSSEANQQSENEQFTSGLAHSVNSSETASQLYGKAMTAAAAAQTSNSVIAQNAVKDAHAFNQEHGITDSNAEYVTGMAALSASLGGNLKVGKTAEVMSSQLGPGVPRAAISNFLQKAGMKDKPGTDLVPASDDPSTVNVGASASGNINATASASSSTKDQTQRSYGQGTSTSSQYEYSEQEKSNFNNDLSAQIQRQDANTFQSSWGTSDASSIQSNASELTAATQAYETASTLQNTIGASSNMSMQMLGGLISGRAQNNGVPTNTEAQNTLREGFNLQSEAVKEDAAGLYERYRALDLPHDIAENTARLTALTNPNNFQDDPSGQLSATMLAANVIKGATGLGGTNQDMDYDRNSGVSTPSFQPGDIQEKAESLTPPNISPMEEIRERTQQPVSNAFSERGELPTENLSDAYTAGKENIQSTGGEKENQLIAKNEAKYREGILNARDMGAAATGFGAYDNATGWVGRKAEQIAGGTQAFLNEVGDGVGDAYNAYKNMTPEQASEARSALNDQNDNLFDSMGVAALPIVGAQMLGNQIIGATMSGVDAAREWMNDGTDLSETAQGMSVQERGAFFAAAAGEIASNGGDAFSSFMEQHGSEFKQSMEDAGQQRYGLSPKQAAVFAESYDTNDESMRQKVLNLQEDYAIRDEKGKPVWDTDNSEWAMTEKNREFTEAMVDQIVSSTSAGDRVGSYLEPISGYNTATQRVTPAP